MSELGQQRTSSAMPVYVRYRGLSGHWMSAFRERCNFPPVMSAFGGKADSLEQPSERLLVAISGHWAHSLEKHGDAFEHVPCGFRLSLIVISSQVLD